MVVLAAAAMGCGGGGQAAGGGGDTTPAGGGGTEPASTAESGGGAEAEVAWADMDRAKRMEFMGLQVLPEMKALFQSHDSGEYGGFQCQNCHGDDFESVDFKMPNSLYGLPEADPIKAANDYNPEVTKFMMEKVVPTMSKLLSKDVTCFSCHQKE